MHKVDIKPMSTNALYQGRRYRTVEYKKYQDALALLLPPVTLPEPPYHVDFVFGLSNMRMDYDNCIKGFQDALANKYGFNDSEIYSASVRKVKTKMGQEFIRFDIRNLEMVNCPRCGAELIDDGCISCPECGYADCEM